ncbi:hypothetical protein Rt10032_c10g4275 [Rhodotorula toruloides]|uniref:Uncharacterized protein n=1 Tax=Rhodotorula toruloides TaxID=5286 RepID=A0A511KIP9_RHOTO|nr:hypothetical protein Rt10032_c10g4275 [Rhodotorula toruloides]
MASFFNRPSYTPSWQQRIYPVREPSFAPASAPTPAPPPASSAPTTPVRDAPPPVYFPGHNRRRSTGPHSPGTSRGDSDLPPGHTASTNTASTSSCVIRWAYHPCAPDAIGGKGKWGKRLRVGEIWRALRAEREVLWDRWPREFGGDERMPWEVEVDGERAARDEEAQVSRRRSTRSTISLSQLRRSTTADSGVALTPHQSRTSAALPSSHPLLPLFQSRIAELNTIIPDSLVLPRVWLALVELMDYVWIVALLVALGQGRGKQTGFLKGVEIALVLVILLNGLAINAVRMRRYTLSTQLRARTRDWSPLPITSSTNAGLMRNYLDGEAERGRTESMAPKEGPVLRWRLRETEGGYWLAYRPIIRCELVIPSSYSYHALQHQQLLAATAAEGGEGSGEGGAEPPRYEEA